MIAFMALLVALCGTSYAAITITGKNVKNSSLTGKDVKNKSLTAADFRGTVRGPRGAAGVTGPTGATGATGPQGVSGVTNVTRLPVASAATMPAGIIYEPLSDVGSFTKAAATSRIMLTWNGLNEGTGTGSWFCDFQLRVDGVEPEGAAGRAVVVEDGDGENAEPAGATGLFDGLPAGPNGVEIWVRSDASGMTDCSVASRGFADTIYVEEMPP